MLAREADGYHGLETLFCLVSLADDAAGGAARGARRDDRGRGQRRWDPPAENLAVRAAAAVLAATGDRFAVHLTLTKRIPGARRPGRRIERRGRGADSR